MWTHLIVSAQPQITRQVHPWINLFQIRIILTHTPRKKTCSPNSFSKFVFVVCNVRETYHSVWLEAVILPYSKAFFHVPQQKRTRYQPDSRDKTPLTWQEPAAAKGDFNNMQTNSLDSQKHWVSHNRTPPSMCPIQSKIGNAIYNDRVEIVIS